MCFSPANAGFGEYIVLKKICLYTTRIPIALLKCFDHLTSLTPFSLIRSGNAVLPVTSAYSGVWDCAVSVRREEGVSGFYKGFGALVMQYTVQVCLIRPSFASIIDYTWVDWISIW